MQSFNIRLNLISVLITLNIDKHFNRIIYVSMDLFYNQSGCIIL